VDLGLQLVQDKSGLQMILLCLSALRKLFTVLLRRLMQRVRGFLFHLEKLRIVRLEPQTFFYQLERLAVLTLFVGPGSKLEEFARGVPPVSA
jgi:hypothetical protein